MTYKCNFFLYIPIMKLSRMVLGENHIYSSIKIKQIQTKYLGINLTKEAKDLYNKKTLKDLRKSSKWTSHSCSWIGRIVLWTWLQFQNGCTESIQSPVTFFFHRPRQNHSDFYMDAQCTTNGHRNGIVIPSLK